MTDRSDSNETLFQTKSRDDNLVVSRNFAFLWWCEDFFGKSPIFGCQQIPSHKAVRASNHNAPFTS